MKLEFFTDAAPSILMGRSQTHSKLEGRWWELIQWSSSKRVLGESGRVEDHTNGPQARLTDTHWIPFLFKLWSLNHFLLEWPVSLLKKQISRLFCGPEWIRSLRAEIRHQHFQTSSAWVGGWGVCPVRTFCISLPVYSSQLLPTLVGQLVYSSQLRSPSHITAVEWQVIDDCSNVLQYIKKNNVLGPVRRIGIGREKCLHSGRDSPAIWHFLD